MPNPRFYSAPIDPGWGHFGQAIAQGMGQATQNWERNRYLELQQQLELDREQRQAAREDQLRAENLALEKQKYAALQATEGTLPVWETNPEELPTVVAGAGGMRGAPLILPSPIQQAAAAAKTAAETASQETGDQDSPVVMALQNLQKAGDNKGLMPKGAYLDPYMGRIVRYDPARSRAAQAEAYQFNVNQERATAAREQIRGVIAKVLEDGRIDRVTEWPILTAWGLKPQDLEDPEEALKRAFAWWEKEQARLHKNRMEEIGAQTTATARALSGQQQLNNLRDNVRGLALAAFTLQGKTAQQIYTELAPVYEKEVGGAGNLFLLINQALNPTGSITYEDAKKQAEQTLLYKGMVPGTEGYDAMLHQEALAIMQAGRDADLSRTSASWPGGFTVPGLGQNGGAITESMTGQGAAATRPATPPPAPARPPFKPPVDTSLIKPRPGAGTVFPSDTARRYPNRAAGQGASVTAAPNPALRAYIGQLVQQGANVEQPAEVGSTLTADQQRIVREMIQAGFSDADIKRALGGRVK